MSRLLLVVLVLVVGLVVGPMVAGSAGYVLVRAGGHTLEMTLVTLVLLVAVLLILLWMSERLLRVFLRFPLWAGSWGQRRRLRRLRQREEAALLRLLAGDSEGAWQLLAPGAGSSARWSVRAAALAAAYRQGDGDRLHALQQMVPEDAAPVWLVLARAALDQGHLADAGAYLERVGSEQRDGTYALLQREVAEASGDWQQLEEALPRLIKSKALAGDELDGLQLKVHEAHIRTQIEKEGAPAGMAYLRQLPRRWRHHPRLLVAASVAQAIRGDTAAIKTLGKVIRTSDDATLLDTLAATPNLPAEALILDAKKGLKNLGPTPSRLALLAHLCDVLGRQGEAQNFRRQASGQG